MRKLLALTVFIVASVSFAETAAEEGTLWGMKTFNAVSLIVLGVVLITVVVICIIKRAKVAAGLRAYKSEMKKITWFPWKSVWRCTAFVLVGLAVIAVVVGFLDVAILELQNLLGSR